MGLLHKTYTQIKIIIIVYLVYATHEDLSIACWYPNIELIKQELI